MVGKFGLRVNMEGEAGLPLPCPWQQPTNHIQERQVMKEKILIVEDNPLNMKLLEMVLRAKTYTLLKATDGKKALDMAMREQPDLIIMDIQRIYQSPSIPVNYLK